MKGEPAFALHREIRVEPLTWWRSNSLLERER
jgi:hypothetical protein